MHTDEPGILRVELKYCERCGGLWLRPQASDEVYCAACAAMMSDFAVSRRSKRHARLPVRNDGDIEAQQPGMEFLNHGGNA